MILGEKQLESWLPELHDAPWVALDLEADSLHCYPEKVCLVQLSIPGQDVLIDTLAGYSLQPLWKELQGREIIMHGCDFDLRMLRKDYDFTPTRVFDTMEAARLVGMRQFGLASLVNEYFNVQLDKASQKANWSRRPLTPRLEAYARLDTHYLQQVAEKLEQRLKELHRLDWLKQTCRRLIQESKVRPEPDPEEVWRLRGSARMTRRELGVLRAIWEWREKEAVEANRPPFFVLPHNTLLLISQQACENNGFLDLLPKRFSLRRREALHRVVQKAIRLAPEQLPVKPRKKGPNRGYVCPERLEKLKVRRDKFAEEMGIDPTLIASRAMLERLAERWEDHVGLLMDWQRKILQETGKD